MAKSFLDALLATPILYGAKVSPNKQWVAWSWSNVNPTAQVYLAPTDGSKPPRRMTNIPQNVFVTSWSRDSQSLIIEHDYDGDERARFYQLALDHPAEPLPLTEEHPPYFIRGGGELTADNRYLIYGANYDFERQREIEPTYVYRHELTTGERVPLAKPLKPADCFPLLNHQGTHILYHRQDLHPAGTQVWLVDIEGKNDREILNFGEAVNVTASWFPDGNHVLFVQEEQRYKKIGMYDIATGTVAWLLDDPARSIEEAYVPHDSTDIVVLETKQAQTCAFLIDVKSKAEQALSAPLTTILLSPVAEKRWISIHYHSQQPDDLVTHTLSDFATRASLTRIWEHVSYGPGDLVRAENYTWTSTDGIPIQGWLYRSRTRSPKGTVVSVHGGPTVHSEDAFNITIQFLVSRGFHVLDPHREVLQPQDPASDSAVRL